MGAAQLGIDIVLVVLLAGSLLQGFLTQRARSGIKRDRHELERLIREFDESNRQAEASAERLRVAADAASRAMGRQIEGASNLKDDLSDLNERGERLAIRLGAALRSEMEPPGARGSAGESELAAGAPSRVRSQAERELLRALRVNR